MSNTKRVDTTPRLGVLQWVGPGLVGLLTLTVALTQEPLFAGAQAWNVGTWNSVMPGLFNFWAMLFYSPILVGLLASLIGAFRALATAPHRQEFRALMDLGAPRRDLALRQTRLGVTHGSIASFAGAALGAGVVQARSGLGGDFSSTTAWTLLVVVGLSVAASTLAYWFVGRWITGGTGRSGAVHDVGGATGFTRPVPKSRLRRFAIPLALVAFVVVSALATPHLTSSTAVSPGLVTAWMLAYGLVVATGLPALVVWAGTRAATWLSGLAGRALLRGGTAARIAGDGLTRPTPARAVAIGAVGLVLGGTLAIGVTLNAVGARNEAGASLTPAMVISTGDYADLDLVTYQAATTTGWEQQPLDPTLIAALQADDRVVVVTSGLLTTRVASTDPAVVVGSDTTTFLTVSPNDLDRVSEGAARALYFGDGVAMGGGPSPSVLTVNGASAEVAVPLVGAPLMALPREWAERKFGAGATSAVLLYDGPGGDADSAIADYDVTGLHVRDLGGAGGSSGPLDRMGVLAVSGSLLVLAVGLVVALSLSIQRTRGHDYATMSALGASRGALRWGTAIESAVVTAAGAAMGLLLGGASGLGLSQSATHAPWRLVWTGATFDLDHAPWGTVALLALASIVAAAVASVVARARVERLTPAEQLREAIKEGSL